MSVDLLHYHYPEDGSVGKHALPPDCCTKAAEKVKRLAVNAAEHSERRRVVLEALESLESYRAAVESIVDPVAMQTVDKVVAACVDRVRKAGCICPMVDISTLSEAPGSRMMPGGDPRCGVHGRANQPRTPDADVTP